MKMPTSAFDAEPPMSDTVKMVWVTSVAHVIYTNPRMNVSLPQEWAVFIHFALGLMLLVYFFISYIIIRLIAKHIEMGQLWARVTFVVLILLSLPTRIYSLFYSNSMFNDARFRFSFFLILIWCIADVVVAYKLYFTEQSEVENQSNA